MQQVGNMLLARAVLTKYHHAPIGGGYQPYAVHDFLKGGTFTGEYRPVSYTHLDVYKRQVHDGDIVAFHVVQVAGGKCRDSGFADATFLCC